MTTPDHMPTAAPLVPDAETIGIPELEVPPHAE